MSTTTIKSSKNNQRLNNEVILQLTKSQVINFFRFLMILAMITINFIAVFTDSALKKELFISQGILVLIYFIKTANSNNIKK